MWPFCFRKDEKNTVLDCAAWTVETQLYVEQVQSPLGNSCRIRFRALVQTSRALAFYWQHQLASGCGTELVKTPTLVQVGALLQR